MTDRKEILKNITQPEERLFLAKVLDRADFCCKRFEKTFTDFCDPAKLSLALYIFSIPMISTIWFSAEMKTAKEI